VLEQNVQPWHVRSHEKHGKKNFSRFPLAIQNKWKKELKKKELSTCS
jgi:hypothetical protein